MGISIFKKSRGKEEIDIIVVGKEGLLEMARKYYKEHQSVYLATLLEYENAHDYEKMKEIGNEVLDKLECDLRMRG